MVSPRGISVESLHGLTRQYRPFFLHSSVECFLRPDQLSQAGCESMRLVYFVNVQVSELKMFSDVFPQQGWRLTVVFLYR